MTNQSVLTATTDRTATNPEPLKFLTGAEEPKNEIIGNGRFYDFTVLFGVRQ
jgi:hypothetical protein